MRILPGRPIVDLALDHPLFSAHTSSRSGAAVGRPSSETEVPHLRAIFDDEGRLLVLISHNTDIADGWEREGVEMSEFFYSFSPAAYGLAINVFLWAMRH